MFQPQHLIAQPFSRMPDEFRKLHPTFGRPHLGASFDCYIEGAAFDREGELYVVDIPYSRVFRISRDGRWTLAARYSGRPKGLKVHHDGRILISDNVLGIMTMDSASGAMNTVLTRSPYGNLQACNDLTVAPNGDVVFTDQASSNLLEPNGSVYRWSKDGTVERLINNAPGPNGVVITADSSRALLSVTRANAIWCLELDSQGRHLKTGTFIQLSGGIGPDGLALDAEGGLIVAHLGMGVWRFDVRGRPTHFIASPSGDMCSSVAFGGPGMKTLYITEASTGTVLQAELPVPGIPT